MKNIYKTILLFTLLFFFNLNIRAQNSGYLVGSVSENTGTTLPGASIYISGTTIGTISDLEGNYVLNDIEPGEYTIGATFLGYEQIEKQITIKAGKNELVFILAPISFTGEEIVVTALHRGQQKAINQQVNAETLVNVVSEDRIKELPDVNAAESIGRLPGVSVNRSGGEGTNIVIRGLAPQLNAVTVNGMRLPSTSLDSRATGLGMISSELLSGIEVYKVPTPDMDAEAIGGTVNLTMKKAPKGFNGAVKASQITNHLANDPKNYKASLQLGNRFFNDKLGLIAQANAEHINRSTHTLYSDYAYDLQEYNRFLSNSVRFILTDQYKERYGGSLNLDYSHKHGSISLFSFGNVGITNTWQQEAFFSRFNIIDYNVTEKEVRNVILNNSLTGDFKTTYFSIDYSGAYSVTEREDPLHYDLKFTDPRANTGEADIDVFAHTPWLVPELMTRSRVDSLYLRSAQFRQNPTKEQNAIGKVDIKIPLNFKNSSKLSGFIKVGSSIKSTIRSSERILDDAFKVYYGEADAQGIISDWAALNGSVMNNPLSRFYSGNVFDMDNIESAAIGKGYLRGVLSPIYDRDATGQLADITKNYSYRDQKESAKNYNVNEMVLGNYAMLNFNFGKKLNIITGFRHEYSDNTYEGFYSTITGKPGEHQGAMTDSVVTTSFSFFLPHFHLRYKISDWIDVRFSNAKTLSRPSYNALIPYYSFDFQGTQITSGNPDLRPYKADNYDLTVSLYSSKYGMVRVGGFYKHITDPYFSSNRNLYNDSVAAANGYSSYFTDWDLKNYINGPEGKVWGYEFELQTSLTNFHGLPGFMRGIIMSFNFSRLYSEWKKQTVILSESTEYDPNTGLWVTTRTEDVYYRKASLQSMVPKTINATLGYNYKKFMCRITANYQSHAAKTISQVRDGLGDKYTQSALRLDFSAKQDIGKRVSLLLNIANLTSERERQFVYDPRWIRQDFHYGMTTEIGIRVKL
jgi:TonB-dependent receptor